MNRIAVDQLKRGIAVILEKAGLPAEASAQTADLLVETEARGVYSHGVGLLDYYVNMMQDGLANPDPDIRIVEDRTAMALIDADNAMGAPATIKALEIAMEKAEKCGTASVGLRHFNHYGAGLYYANKAAERGKMLFLYANANPTVAVPGGKQGFLGTNPYTFGAPAGKYAPFVLDMATSIAAYSKMRHYKELPEGWGINSEGRPAKTMDEVIHGGALLPFGGFKGYGLSLMINVMSGILTGASYGYDIRCVPLGPDKLANIGAWMLCVDIEALMDYQEYTARMEDYIDLLHNNELAEGYERICYPGQMEGERYEKALKEGLELSDFSAGILEKCAGAVGMTVEEALG